MDGGWLGWGAEREGGGRGGEIEGGCGGESEGGCGGRGKMREGVASTAKVPHMTAHLPRGGNGGVMR